MEQFYRFLAKLYGWLYPVSHAKFINGLPEESQARGAAFWNSLSPCESGLFITFILLGIAAAIIYFKPFNNKPGRHYRGRWWWFFAAIAFFGTLLVSYILCGIILKDARNLGQSLSFQHFLSWGNAFYAFVLYFIISFIWWNWGKTNAYRFCYPKSLHKK